MRRRRGRPTRQYRLRVRTGRRTPIDYDALARAALEQAAMDQQPGEGRVSETPPNVHSPRRRNGANRLKGSDHDRLA